MAGSHETNPNTQKVTTSKKSKSKSGKSGISTLENLGNPMNTMKNAMNAKNFLGRHKGRMSKSRNSLDILSEPKNSLGILSVNKNSPRGKGRRRYILARNPLLKDRE